MKKMFSGLSSPLTFRHVLFSGLTRMPRVRFHLHLFALALLAAALTPAFADDGGRFDHLQPLAEKGEIDAQHRLGNMYAKGEGAPHDYVLAHKWFNLAAAGGHEEARSARNIFSQLMTPEQVAEAQKLARDWFAQHRHGEK